MCSSFGSLDSRVSFLARLLPNHTCLTTQVGNHTLMFHDAKEPCRCRRFLCRVVGCRAVLPADVQASSGKQFPQDFAGFCALPVCRCRVLHKLMDMKG